MQRCYASGHIVMLVIKNILLFLSELVKCYTQKEPLFGLKHMNYVSD